METTRYTNWLIAVCAGVVDGRPGVVVDGGDRVFDDVGLVDGDGEAETTYKGDRLIVRRTRLVGRQARVWPEWRHHAFVTDRAGTVIVLDANHRDHAVIELAIRDLKEGAGWNGGRRRSLWPSGTRSRPAA